MSYDQFKMQDFIDLINPAPLSLSTLFVDLLLCLSIAALLAWFYVNYGRSFSNRTHLAQSLPALALTTLLIISIVKSSLALSLGLVGALSIVRFRTAIKEPEELVFLFIAIAIGLGFGAGQRWPTILGIAIILGYLWLRTILVQNPLRNNLYLNVNTSDSEDAFEKINVILNNHSRAVRLYRLDRNDAGLQATYLLDSSNEATLSAVMNELSTTLQSCELSFVEQDSRLGN